MTEQAFNLEQALNSLESIVQQLEAGDLPLDEAVQLFERGQNLLRHCEKNLEAKALHIQQIMEDDSLAPLEF